MFLANVICYPTLHVSLVEKKVLRGLLVGCIVHALSTWVDN